MTLSSTDYALLAQDSYHDPVLNKPKELGGITYEAIDVCTIDNTAVDVNDDCTSNMAFGGVTDAKGATLEDNFQATSAKPVAHVGEHQLLCIQATQRKEGVLVRALVKAVPTKTVKGCKANEICKGADTPVEWKRPGRGTACTLKPDGHYTGDCATGWVDGKDIEEYSMGLNPEDTGA